MAIRASLPITAVGPVSEVAKAMMIGSGMMVGEINPIGSKVGWPKPGIRMCDGFSLGQIIKFRHLRNGLAYAESLRAFNSSKVYGNPALEK